MINIVVVGLDGVEEIEYVCSTDKAHSDLKNAHPEIIEKWDSETDKIFDWIDRTHTEGKSETSRSKTRALKSDVQAGLELLGHIWGGYDLSIQKNKLYIRPSTGAVLDYKYLLQQITEEHANTLQVLGFKYDTKKLQWHISL